MGKSVTHWSQWHRPIKEICRLHSVLGMMKPIKAWPESERPRERLLSQGAGALSDAELLADEVRDEEQIENLLDE